MITYMYLWNTCGVTRNEIVLALAQTTNSFHKFLTSISQVSHKPVFLGLNCQFKLHHTLKESLFVR